MRAGRTRFMAVMMTAVLCTLSGCASWGPPPEGEDESAVAGAFRSKEYRIAATSAAILDILDKLDHEYVVGIPQTEKTIPERYLGATNIGAPMDPDLEVLSSIAPDIVLSPMTLEASLGPDYDKAMLKSGFVNLSSVEGMYDAIRSLGDLLDRQDAALELTQGYESYLSDYRLGIPEQGPDVLLLMCFPDGFYLVCTENCYVGNLVALAGGKNVYSSGEEGMESGFVNINPEDIVQRTPDKILVFAHYNEKDAFSYMEQEFATNETWQYFDAVKENEVYYLSADLFGMSATLKWTEAMEALKPMLYEE